jgi:hypothetical protein
LLKKFLWFFRFLRLPSMLVLFLTGILCPIFRIPSAEAWILIPIQACPSQVPLQIKQQLS